MKLSDIGGDDKRPRSILDEIKKYSPTQINEEAINSRANHIIQSAMNMFEKLDEMYDGNTSEMLKRRFVSSIKNGDPEKFSRAINRLKKD